MPLNEALKLFNMQEQMRDAARREQKHAEWIAQAPQRQQQYMIERSRTAFEAQTEPMRQRFEAMKLEAGLNEYENKRLEGYVTAKKHWRDILSESEGDEELQAFANQRIADLRADFIDAPETAIPKMMNGDGSLNENANEYRTKHLDVMSDVFSSAGVSQIDQQHYRDMINESFSFMGGQADEVVRLHPTSDNIARAILKTRDVDLSPLDDEDAVATLNGHDQQAAKNLANVAISLFSRTENDGQEYGSMLERVVYSLNSAIEETQFSVTDDAAKSVAIVQSAASAIEAHVAAGRVRAVAEIGSMVNSRKADALMSMSEDMMGYLQDKDVKTILDDLSLNNSVQAFDYATSSLQEGMLMADVVEGINQASGVDFLELAGKGQLDISAPETIKQLKLAALEHVGRRSVMAGHVDGTIVRAAIKPIRKRIEDGEPVSGTIGDALNTFVSYVAKRLPEHSSSAGFQRQTLRLGQDAAMSGQKAFATFDATNQSDRFFIVPDNLVSAYRELNISIGDSPPSDLLTGKDGLDKRDWLSPHEFLGGRGGIIMASDSEWNFWLNNRQEFLRIHGKVGSEGWLRRKPFNSPEYARMDKFYGNIADDVPMFDRNGQLNSAWRTVLGNVPSEKLKDFKQGMDILRSERDNYQEALSRGIVTPAEMNQSVAEAYRGFMMMHRAAGITWSMFHSGHSQRAFREVPAEVPENVYDLVRQMENR